MGFDFLRAGLGFASVGLMVIGVGSGACGGNVVVDGAPTGTSSTGGASVSSSSGSCGCNQFCATVSSCSAPADKDKCLPACPTLPSSILACVCGTPPGDCGAVQNCFGG